MKNLWLEEIDNSRESISQVDRQLQTFAIESHIAYQFILIHGGYYGIEFFRDMQKIPSLKSQVRA